MWTLYFGLEDEEEKRDIYTYIHTHVSSFVHLRFKSSSFRTYIFVWIIIKLLVVLKYLIFLFSGLGPYYKVDFMFTCLSLTVDLTESSETGTLFQLNLFTIVTVDRSSSGSRNVSFIIQWLDVDFIEHRLTRVHPIR